MLFFFAFTLNKCRPLKICFRRDRDCFVFPDTIGTQLTHRRFWCFFLFCFCFTFSAQVLSAVAPVMIIVGLIQPVTAYVYVGDGVLQGSKDFVYEVGSFAVRMKRGLIE